MRNEKLNDKDTLRRRALKGTAVLGIAASALGLGGCYQHEASAEAQASGAVEVSQESGAVDEPLMSGAEGDTEAPQSSPEQEVSVESLRISAELPSEEVAQELQDLKVKWGFAGATPEDFPETKKGRRAWNGDVDDYRRQLAEKNADIYAPILLGSDWATDETRVQERDSLIEFNDNWIAVALKYSASDKALPGLSWSVSDVEEYDNAADVENLGDFRYVDNTRAKARELGDGKMRFIEYTATPIWTNNPDGDSEPVRVGMALQVEDDGTLSLIEQSSARIR